MTMDDDAGIVPIDFSGERGRERRRVVRKGVFFLFDT